MSKIPKDAELFSYSRTETHYQPTINPRDFQIEESRQIRANLALKVRYLDGDFYRSEVLVYVGSTLEDAIKWRVIDPTFNVVEVVDKHTAPSPTGRFPGSQEGWDAAVWFISTYKMRAT